MPSSKKKQKGKAKKGAASSSGGTATAKRGPRSFAEIIGGRADPNRPPKKAVVRELYDALLHDVNSESRAALIAKVAALGKVAEGDGESEEGVVAEQNRPSDELPITYETKGMIDQLGGRSMLTFGRNAKFRVERTYHDRPTRLIQHFQNDEEKLTMARRWTGEDSVVNIIYPPLKILSKNAIVFLGECYLHKEDLAHFAGRFEKGPGGSIYDWPVSKAVLQCPFTCTLAVPDKDKTTAPKRYVMILQNIQQFAVIDGGLHMPHRGLPRLCDKEYFAKNFLGGIELSKDGNEAEILPPSTEWCQYPQILEEGIVFRAARKVLPPSALPSLATSSENYLPSAYTLFNFYHECGMCAAVSTVIEDKQNQIMRESSVFPNIK